MPELERDPWRTLGRIYLERDGAIGDDVHNVPRLEYLPDGLEVLLESACVPHCRTYRPRQALRRRLYKVEAGHELGQVAGVPGRANRNDDLQDHGHQRVH